MLPNLRAVIVAVASAVALLAAAFGVVATFRVAQESRAGVLQADLAQRARAPVPASDAPRLIPIIEAPQRPPAKHDFAEALEAVPVTPVIAAAALVEPVPVAPVIAAAPLTAPAAPAPQMPSAEPPIGGPLPDQIAVVHSQTPSHDAATEKAARKKAAEKKTRSARIERERKARRAAQIRRARQSAAAQNAPSGDSFNSFGNSANTFGNNTFGNTTFGDSFGAAPRRNSTTR